MMDTPSTTVLVVDDSAENVTLLSRILKMSGYDVAVARDGAEAIDATNRFLPDLIILDINMPLMDGFETSERLKADERTRDIPIIFISALDNVQDKARAFRAGAIDYILKPFEYEEVQARIETHLVLRRLRLQLEQTNKELAARVDELTKSQKLLAERERRLSAFIAALPNLSFILDEQGNCLESITTGASLLMAAPSQKVGQAMHEVMPANEGAKLMDAIQQTLADGSIQVVEYRVPTHSGREHWFEGRLACMEKDKDGHGKVVLMASEITERVRLYQEVERLANEDALTGCFNRRYFMIRASEEIERGMRYKRPISLLMMDIDHFKEVNDRFGHQVGDQMLCELVEICQKQLRSQDVLGRYGGEEFVILMPETTQSGAMCVSERLRQDIEKMKVVTSAGELSITASMGVATLKRGFDKSQTIDSLVKKADTALYAAKDAGRNCVRASDK